MICFTNKFFLLENEVFFRDRHYRHDRPAEVTSFTMQTFQAHDHFQLTQRAKAMVMNHEINHVRTTIHANAE